MLAKLKQEHLVVKEGARSLKEAIVCKPYFHFLEFSHSSKTVTSSAVSSLLALRSKSNMFI